MTGSIRALALSVGSSLAMACASSPAMTPDVGGAVDGGQAGNDGAALHPLFSPCTASADCASGDCRISFPGGMCTMACTADADCGTGGVCAFGICLPACHSGDGTCAPNGACVTPSGSPSFCTAACWPEDRRPADWTPCNDGLVCNELRSRCVDPAMLPTTGAPNGGPCTANADCLSDYCLTEVSSTGVPTGYIGGTCAGTGLLPPDSAFVTGTALPRSNCVEGSIVLPGTGGRPGDFTLCFAECTTNTDCRAGYECSRGAGNEYASGACLPVLCDMPGVTCPTGYGCQVIGGLSRCVAM